MIIIVEPQCSGFEHTEFNSAFLLLMQETFPSESILFFAEQEHLQLVRGIVLSQLCSSIEYHSIIYPDRKLSEARRFISELKFTRQIFKIAKKNNCRKLIFASVNSSILWCIKLLLRLYTFVRVIVIPHSILETINKKPHSGKPWIYVFWFRLSLKVRNLSRLKYLLLGESIRIELVKSMPKIGKYVNVIDHPYRYAEYVAPLKEDLNVLRFGSLGTGRREKGTDLFFSLATDVRQRTDKSASEFILIGPITDEETRKLVTSDVLIPSDERALSREDFDKYAHEIDYSVFCYPSESYKLTASGAFFDALSFVKPIIALRNPFFEYYFKQLGDIGYLCQNYEEMLDVVIDLIRRKEDEPYINQCNNIIKGRELLGIPNLSVKMRDILC